MPPKSLVIFTSGVPSYGNAEAKVILIKMRQGVKNRQNKVSVKRHYLKEKQKALLGREEK